MAPRRLLVTGATGAQGGATIKALLADPPRFEHKILALTRNTSSNKAQALAANPNVEVISGDLDDSARHLRQRRWRGLHMGCVPRHHP